MTRGRAERFYATRLIWAWHHGVWPDNLIDHIDGDTLNDRIENLRDVPAFLNSHNTNAHTDSKSGAIGVWYAKTRGKWKASIMVNGHKRNLGSFNSRQSAIAARKTAEKEMGVDKYRRPVRG